MKKLFLIVLCFAFMAGSALAGAGGNAGATKDNPRQAGKSSVYFYDVECSSAPNPDCIKCKPCAGYGTVVIDIERKTFNFIGHNYAPMSKVRVENLGAAIKGKVTPSGNIHVQGTSCLKVLLSRLPERSGRHGVTMIPHLASRAKILAGIIAI